MKVLILGSGGREHALAWRLSQDPEVSLILGAPGNPGLAGTGQLRRCDILNGGEVLALAEREAVDLTVVGPEAPLDHGVVDLFRRAGRAIVGPSQRGAQLESSKSHAKAFMERHGIPTARFVVCDDATSALQAVSGSEFGFPVVVKADGLAAGKGVTVATSREEAESAIRAAMLDRQFGDAGARVVIEECLTGPEVSMFFLCDGAEAVALGSAQDHKRIFDDDRGPNTGGMGAFAPSPLATDRLTADVRRAVVEPVLRGHQDEGDPYTGFLYVSLMLTPAGFRVIEFNVRFGDPEAQVVLPLVEGSLFELLQRAARGGLRGAQPGLSGDKTVGIVLASRGYPATSESGRVIDGIEDAAAVPGAIVFHAGTRSNSGRIETAGGRVLTVVGRGRSYTDAMSTAYRAASAIHFDGVQFRRDIGAKALEVTP